MSKMRKVFGFFFYPKRRQTHSTHTPHNRDVGKMLVVVRGSYRGTDPTFACIAHNTVKNQYAAIELTDGRVTDRTLYRSSERRALEKHLADYRGTVFVDKRKARATFPLTAPASASEADLMRFRRAVGNGVGGAAQARRPQLPRTVPLREAVQFRGASSSSVTPVRSAHNTVKRSGFVQYRGGYQTRQGLYSELSRGRRTPAWQERLDRVHRGLDEVEKYMKPGARVADLDRIFMAHMDDDADVVYGSVLHHTGYEPHESGIPLETIQKYDFLTLGATVGDGKDTAVVYRSAHGFHDSVPSPPPHVPTHTFVDTALPEPVVDAPPPPEAETVVDDTPPEEAVLSSTTRAEVVDADDTFHTERADSGKLIGRHRLVSCLSPACRPSRKNFPILILFFVPNKGEQDTYGLQTRAGCEMRAVRRGMRSTLWRDDATGATLRVP